MNKRNRWNCVDCSENTSKLKEHYFVTTQVWFEEARMPERGMLCISCLETRISRPLVSSDFPDVHINNPKLYAMSQRLLDRLTAV